MKTTTLIQRVCPPYPQTNGPVVASPFSFGGGLRNGGLGKEAVELLGPIFSFAYMGAAEFEFGAVPEAFGKILTASQEVGLVYEELEIPTKDIKLKWQPKDAVPVETKTVKVWVVCAKPDKEEILDRVKFIICKESSFGYSTPERDGTVMLRERTNLGQELKLPDKKDRHSTRGGIELNNGFAVFIDEDMAKKFFALFSELNHA